jgi:hypothetical protein
MVVFAVIGILAFLIGLLVRAPQKQEAASSGFSQPVSGPRWYELTLALILLAAIAAFAIWLISNGGQWLWGDVIDDWRSDTRGMVFAAIMVGIAVVGLVVSLIYALVQSSQPVSRRPAEATAQTAPAGAAAAPTPAPLLRAIGVLAFALSILLLCWIALTAAERYLLIAQLIYPAALGVALVLLLDKATRTWGSKGGAEAAREWLFCDLLIFLLVLAFLNLRGIAKPEAYTGSFWDILNVVLFFIAFWLVDRTAARSRFLVGYGYLIALPLLLLIWDTVQGTASPASWWGSPWPFLILAVVFFVLEAVTLVSSTEERQTLPAVKDAVFVLAYGVLLIIAARSHV